MAIEPVFIQWARGPRNLHADEIERYAALYRERSGLRADAPLRFQVSGIYWSDHHLPDGVIVEAFDHPGPTIRIEPVGGVSDTAASSAPDRPATDHNVAERANL